MFGNKEKNSTTKAKPVKSTMPTSNALNSLVQGTEIEGKLTAQSDIRVDGVIKGSLNCKAKVIIGPTGIIDGDIVCENAIIEGKFLGTLNVKELLNVRSSAVIEGEITTQKLIVESGAVFNVTCRMGNQESHGTVTRKSSTKIATLKKEAS